jgi:ribosome silencing factor RsfS/YbeB/iojap
VTPQLKASAAAAAKRDGAAKAAGKAAAATPAAPRPVRPARARKPKVEPALLDRLVVAAQKSLEDDKAENIVVLDVTGRADYADRLVIATGLVDRQIQAMATHLEDAFEKAGLKLRRDSIQGSPDWVLIDAGDLVVHLFKPEARGLYALERMWGPESPAPEAAQDRTPLPDDGVGGSTATEEDDE